MVRGRIGYGLALACALLFQINFTGFLSFFVLIFTLYLPPLALLLSLPAILGCRVRVSAVDQVERGGTACFRIEAAGGAGLPFSRATLVVETANRLTGETRRRRVRLSGGSQGVAVEEPADTAHCGGLECRVTRVRVCDCLGLFALAVRAPAPVTLWVMPKVVEPEGGSLPEAQTQEGTSLRPRPGGGPGEDYDLRPYRAGDSMRSIHWKLSSKKDALVVRETLEPHRPALVVTFDHFGDLERLDAVLDRLLALSRALLARERPHMIQWAEPVTGVVRSYPVSDEKTLGLCLRAALSDPAPVSGRSVLDAPIRLKGSDGPVRHLHITAGEEAAR